MSKNKGHQNSYDHFKRRDMTCVTLVVVMITNKHLVKTSISTLYNIEDYITGLASF